MKLVVVVWVVVVLGCKGDAPKPSADPSPRSGRLYVVPANDHGQPPTLTRQPVLGLVGAVGEEREDPTIYKVVLNHEEQYSIWPAERENALGWKDSGKQGTKGECLDYIKEVWTDMRPLSLRKAMEEAAKGSAP